MKKIINTKAAPAAIGPYSQGVSFGNLVMTSGQLPLDPTTMAFPEGGVREQTRQSLLNLKAVLGNDSNLLIVFYVQIMPDDFVMQLHRF